MFFICRKTITPSVLEGREARILESRGLGGEVSRVFEIPLGTGGGKINLAKSCFMHYFSRN